MIYEITFKKQFKALEFVLFITACIIGLIIYQKFNERSIFFGFIFFLVSFIPVLYLHLEYYITNRNAQLEINNGSKKIKYTQANRSIELNFDDVREVIFNMAPSFHRRSKMQFLTFEPYHYARIISNDAKEIIITSLMIHDIEPELRYFKDKFIKKKRLFSSIKLEKIMTDLFD